MVTKSKVGVAHLKEPSMEVMMRSTSDCPLLVNPIIVWIFSPARKSEGGGGGGRGEREREREREGGRGRYFLSMYIHSHICLYDVCVHAECTRCTYMQHVCV